MRVKIIETEDRIEIWWGGAKFASLVKYAYQAMGYTPEWAIASQFAITPMLLTDYLQQSRNAGEFSAKCDLCGKPIVDVQGIYVYQDNTVRCNGCKNDEK